MVDSNIHLLPGWATHVQADGSNIAPGTSTPTNYGFVQGFPGFPTSMLLFTDAAANGAWEAYTQRPLASNSGRLIFDFDLTVDAGFLASEWIMETDTKLVSGQKQFNCSLQRVAANNAIQISNQGGVWVNAGITAPPFVAGVPMHHQFVYGFDVATGRYGIEEINIGGSQNLVPFLLDELTDIATTWPDGAYPQLQMQVGPNGGKTRILIDNMQYTWG